MAGTIHHSREYKEEDMGEKIVNSRWTSYVSSGDACMTGRWQLLNTRSRYSSWARARDVDLEALNMAAELQPDQSTIPPRTASGPLLVLLRSVFLQSAKIPFKA